MSASKGLRAFLTDNSIPFQHAEHPPIFTVDEAAIHLHHLPGTGSKNLFLRDKSGRRHFLVSVPDHKRVNLSQLARLLESDRLSFGSPERLRTYLGITPGAVSLLSVINDSSRAVEIFIDRELWESPLIHCHPLVNTETVIIAPQELIRFFDALGRSPQIIDIPADLLTT